MFLRNYLFKAEKTTYFLLKLSGFNIFEVIEFLKGEDTSCYFIYLKIILHLNNMLLDQQSIVCRLLLKLHKAQVR